MADTRSGRSNRGGRRFECFRLSDKSGGLFENRLASTRRHVRMSARIRTASSGLYCDRDGDISGSGHWDYGGGRSGRAYTFRDDVTVDGHVNYGDTSVKLK